MKGKKIKKKSMECQPYIDHSFCNKYNVTQEMTNRVFCNSLIEIVSYSIITIDYRMIKMERLLIMLIKTLWTIDLKKDGSIEQFNFLKE